MPTRIARTAWNGDLMEGSGQVELSSSKAGTFDVDFPRRAAEDADGTTSPEELIGAAHSACYAMSLAGELGRAGGTTHSLEVSAEVDVGKDPNGKGLAISQVRLRVIGEVEGVDEATFIQVAEKAKVGCPVSKALAGVEITLDASLA